MEVEDFKEKLDDETYGKLVTFVEKLVGQRDHAKNEQINHRKGMKEKISTLETQVADALEKLGIDTFEELEDFPDIKGVAEADKQLQAKVSRLERQLTDSNKSREGAINDLREEKKGTALSKAFNGYDFVAPDVVQKFVKDSLVWEGEDLLYRQDDGSLISVSDGVAGFAKSRPEMLKAAGAGGAGVRSNNARGSAEQLSMTRADFEALPPDKQMEAAKSGKLELH